MKPPTESRIDAPPSPTLSASQLARLAELGEERAADTGQVLYQVGDRDYPFIAVIEGEVMILDTAGKEIVRHGPSGFLGELNLLSGQTVFVTAVVTQPLRYIAVRREALRALLYEDGPLSDVLLSPSSPGARRFRPSPDSAWRSLGRAHLRRRCGCSISRAAIVCP